MDRVDVHSRGKQTSGYPDRCISLWAWAVGDGRNGRLSPAVRRHGLLDARCPEVAVVVFRRSGLAGWDPRLVPNPPVVTSDVA